MPGRRRLRWALAALGALVVVLVAGGIGLYVAERYQGRDVVGSSTEEFVVDRTSPIRCLPPGPRSTRPSSWPTYGYATRADAHLAAPASSPVRASLDASGGRNLLEFPPSIAYGRLYVSNIDGITWAVAAKTGKAVWRHAIRESLRGLDASGRRRDSSSRRSSTRSRATRPARRSSSRAGDRVRRPHRRGALEGDASARPSPRRSSSGSASSSGLAR